MVITNAGPLIALAKLGQLGLLDQVYEHVAMPEAVQQEVVEEGHLRGYADALPISIAISLRKLKVMPVVVTDPRLKAEGLDKGERAAIQLALDTRSSLVLLDDEQARKAAKLVGLSVKGTVGVIVEAFRKSVLTREDVRALFDMIEGRDDIWISDQLIEVVWRSLSKPPK